MIRHMLMAGASRLTYAPQNDEGHEDADAYDPALDDEDVGDADEGDEAGGEEDHLDDDLVGDDDGEDDGQAEVAVRPSRGENRVAAATRAAAEARERAEAAERRLADIESRQNQQRQQETEAQERERLALMDPDERAAYIVQRSEQRMEQRLAQIQFTAADSADKTAFEGLCARNPAVAALKDEVEQRLKEMRAGGFTAERETVVKYLLGERALAKQPRAKGNGAKTAAAQRERQQVRVSSGRGDIAPAGRRGGSEAEQRRRRLENIEI